MDTQRLAQLLREGADDYSQLLDGYPNATAFFRNLGHNVMDHVPKTEEFKDPEIMFKYGQKLVDNQVNAVGDKLLRGAGLDHYREAIQGYMK